MYACKQQDAFTHMHCVWMGLCTLCTDALGTHSNSADLLEAAILCTHRQPEAATVCMPTVTYLNCVNSNPLKWFMQGMYKTVTWEKERESMEGCCLTWKLNIYDAMTQCTSTKASSLSFSLSPVKVINLFSRVVITYYCFISHLCASLCKNKIEVKWTEPQ